MNLNIYIVIFVISGILALVLVYLYLKLLQEKNDLQLEYAVLNMQYEKEMKASYQQIEILKNAKDDLSREFKLLANQIFEDKTKRFDEAHKEQFEMLLKPFREQIVNFSTQSRDQFNHELKERHLLKDELVRLSKMNEQLSQEATNLTNALKGDNKAQGNWGEMILQRILEESGLREGMEYETQTTLKGDEGKIYRPDVIIHMPEDRDIVIDSKVSLVAYERFMSADEPDVKAQALKAHIESIHLHVRGLSSKNYEKLDGINTLDYVLLFMPIEGAFSLALEVDDEFFKSAFDKNILVVSPSTLLVTLRTIEHIWRTQHQQDHAMKIAQEAQGMYEKLVLFVDEMQHIGSSLQKAQDSFDISMNRLNSGKGNIIKRAQNIVSLGVKPTKILSIKSEEF